MCRSPNLLLFYSGTRPCDVTNLSLRLVGAVGPWINVSSFTMRALDLNPGSHGCKPSAITSELSRYP